MLERGETQEYLLRLCEQAGLLQQVDSEEWEIHPVVKKFSEQAGQLVDLEEMNLAQQWLSTILNLPEVKQEYENAMRSVYSEWRDAPMQKKNKLMKSPLPIETHLVVRAFRSLLNAKSVDLYQLLDESHTSFTAREMRYIRLAELGNRQTWKKASFTMAIILGLLLFSLSTKVELLLMGRVIAFSALTYYLFYYYRAGKEQGRNRDLLIFQIWRQRISER